MKSLTTQVSHHASHLTTTNSLLCARSPPISSFLTTAAPLTGRRRHAALDHHGIIHPSDAEQVRVDIQLVKLWSSISFSLEY